MPIGPAVRLDIPLDLQPAGAHARVELELFALAPSGLTERRSSSVLRNAAPGMLPLPRDADGRVLALPQALTLQPATVLASGEHFYIRLTDRDEDRDPFTADTIELSVFDGAGGEDAASPRRSCSSRRVRAPVYSRGRSPATRQRRRPTTVH